MSFLEGNTKISPPPKLKTHFMRPFLVYPAIMAHAGNVISWPSTACFTINRKLSRARIKERGRVRIHRCGLTNPLKIGQLNQIVDLDVTQWLFIHLFVFVLLASPYLIYSYRRSPRAQTGEGYQSLILPIEAFFILQL